ncbi:MAG: YqaA family protein [Pseudomonadota bacterium]
MISYGTLFLSAFLAATFLPLSSELVLLTLLATGEYYIVLLWGIATVANTLGAVFNWSLGLYFIHFKSRAWFPFSEDKIAKAQRWFQRYGVWSLLFSWLPIVGDPLTFIAGTMRVRFFHLVILAGLGKGLRYGVVIVLALGVVERF